MTALPRRRMADMDPAQQAGILCNDARFQKFAAQQCGMPDQQFNASAAAEFLRDWCQIQSRRHLTTSKAAQGRFQILRSEFDAWTGKISKPT